MKRKILSLILALSMFMMLVPMVASAVEYSGTDGGNLTWTFDTVTGKFTISGEGEMYPWTAPVQVTWRNYSTKIKKIVIGDGVTNISSYAFANCSQLQEVVIGDGVRRIGENAFLNAKSLTNITIPKSVELIEYRAFCSCPMLETLVLEATSANIYYYAFENTPISEVYYIGTEDTWDENNYSVLFDGITLTTESIGGKAGENIRYVLSNPLEGGVLEFIGSGDMYTWDDGENTAPWYKYRDAVNIIMIDEGISSIGAYAFFDHTNLNYTNIPFNMNYIGQNAFLGCHSLDTAVYAGTKSDWDEHVSVDVGNDNLLDALNLTTEVSYEFDNGVLTVWSHSGSIPAYDDDDNRAPWYDFKDEISRIIISEGIVDIGGYAFADYYNLNSLKLPASLENIGHASFRNCPLTDINYAGSKREWMNVSIAGENDAIWNADIQFDDSEDPTVTPSQPGSGSSGGGGGSNEDVYYPDSLWISDIEASSGEGITVFVSAGEMVLASLGSFVISYDDTMLTLTGYDFLGALSGLSSVANPNYNGLNKFYASFMNVQNVYLEGEILALHFDVNTWVQDDTYIPIYFENVDLYYETEEPTYTPFINGGIHVLNYTMGDVNQDGIIDLRDALRTLQYDAGLRELSNSAMKAADVNYDGCVTILDALLIQKHCAKLETIF